jgi:hypothetical protein
MEDLISRRLEPGERVRAWGECLMRPSFPQRFLWGLWAWRFAPRYLAVVTDRRLVLLPSDPDATQTAHTTAAPLSDVHVIDSGPAIRATIVNLRVAGRRYWLQFSGTFEDAGAAVSAALQESEGEQPEG